MKSEPETFCSGELGNLAVLGSTGSIGKQTLDIVRANPGRFKVVSLAARSGVEEIAEQAREFRPDFIALADPEAARKLEDSLGSAFEVGAGAEAICHAATMASVHTVVCGIVGFAALEPVLAALKSHKHMALANKESLVAAGTLVRTALEDSSSVLVPVDSEHNSIFQCLLGRGKNRGLRRVVLTASGGPFLNKSKEELLRVRPEESVKHPRWKMGAKISVDSATLMNKGLEVIEASVLFDVPGEAIEVLIHPQSLVHGFIEYEEGTVLAALFETDMRVPIAFSLSYLMSKDPSELAGDEPVLSGVSYLDLIKNGDLRFLAPDMERFPALSLCYEALASGGTAPAVLNAANEIAVYSYLKEEIGFMDIPRLVSEVMGRHSVSMPKSLEDVLEADAWGRECASNIKGRVCTGR